MTDWRQLPPVEDNVPRQDNASATLLARMAVCPRSGYLYLRHKGGPGSHEMDRGSAFHEWRRRATLLQIEQGEHQLPWEIGKDLIAEVVAEHPEWVIPPDEMDHLRLMAYHSCEAEVFDPGSVLAVEQLFELPLAGYRVRGKVDVAYAVGDNGIAVRDYKTQAFFPAQDEFEAKLQTPLYALVVGEGYPVLVEPCGTCGEPGKLVPVDGDPRTWTCPECDGTGRIETPQPPIGERAGWFDLAEVYPRLEPWDEPGGLRLANRSAVVTRQELVDHRLYVESLLAKLEHGFATGEWQAVPGSHCSTCAAPSECPLPARLRDHKGTINTLDEAQEAAESLVFDQADVKARTAELRNFAKAHDVPIPVGADQEFGFEAVESEEWVTGKKIGRPDSAAAREQMQEAVARAVEFGEPFEYDEFRRVRRSSRFGLRKRNGGDGDA